MAMSDAIPENYILLVDAFVVQICVDVLSVSRRTTGRTSVAGFIGVITKCPDVAAAKSISADCVARARYHFDTSPGVRITDAPAPETGCRPKSRLLAGERAPVGGRAKGIYGAQRRYRHLRHRCQDQSASSHDACVHGECNETQLP